MLTVSQKSRVAIKFVSSITALVLFFMMTVLLTACSSADSKGYLLVRSGTLTVATSADAEPFEYWQDDEIVGFDSALAEELASRLGLTYSIENVQFNEISKAMEAGRSYDVAIASLTIPSQEPEGVAYSSAYYYADDAIIVRSDSIPQVKEEVEADDANSTLAESGQELERALGGISSASTGRTTSETSTKDAADLNDSLLDLDSLKDKRIASVSGYSQLRYIEENLSENVYEYSTVQSCIEALELGEVDAVVLEYYHAKVQVANHPSLEILARCASTSSYGVMVNSKNAELLEDINTALNDMKEDGTLSRLENEFLK